VVAYYNVGALGTGTLTISVGSANASDFGSYAVPVVNPGVLVTPDDSAAPERPAQSGGHSQVFTVKNTGTGSETFTITCSGSTNVTCSGANPSSVSLGAGAQTNVTASYSVTNGGTGALTLTATSVNFPSTADVGSYAITVTLPAGAPRVDATVYNPAVQDYARCAVACFAAAHAQGTVPYVSLDAPRNVVLVYNSDRHHPRPFVHVNVQPDPPYGTPTEYRFQVKVSGSFVTFINGEQTLRFAYGGTSAQRIGGQFSATSYATGVYLMDVLVSAYYSGGALITTVISTKLVVVNEASAAIAAGWTLAGIQRAYPTADGSVLITEGDGSAVFFQKSSGVDPFKAPPGEFSRLVLSTPSGGQGWTRMFADSTKLVFNSAGRLIEVRDRFNNVATIVYDGSNRVSQVKDPLNLTITLAANGLATITDPNGRVTTVTVNASRQLTNLKDPDNISTAFGYDGSARLNTITNRRGQTTTVAYDSHWKLSTVTAPSISFVGSNGADSSGAPVTGLAAWQRLGVPTSSTAGTPAPAIRADTVRASVTDPGGHVTRFTVNRWGTPVQVTAPLAQVTTTTFDVSGLPVRSAYPTGGADSAAYNASGLPTYLRTAGDSATFIRYAAWAQPDSVWGVGQPTVRHYLGANGRVDSTKVGGTLRARYWYDTRGRVDSLRDGQTHLVQRTWYAGVNGTHSKDSLPGGRVTRYWQDAFGRDTAVQGPGQPMRRVHYDVLNRPIRFYDGVYATPTVTAYDALYDTSVTDAKGQIYRFGYNALGWVIRRTDPAGKSDTLRYSREGVLRKWTNRRNQTITFTYDSLHRRTGKSGTNTTTESWTYSSNNRVLTGTAPLATETVYLGVSGRPDSAKTVMAGQTYWRRSRWTAAGLLDSVAPSGAGLTFQARKYVWNTTTGAVAEIRLGALPATQLQYNTDGRLSTLTLPGGEARSFQYTPLHEQAEIASAASYEPTVTRFLSFDPAGRIARQLLGNGIDGHGYGYDGLGRLLVDSTIHNQGSTECDPPEIIDENGNTCIYVGDWQAAALTSFTYDSVGNRTDNGGTYLTGNRISAFAGCTYQTDLDGNVTQRSCPGETVTFAWSAEGRLTSTTVGGQALAYHYDASGRLVRKDVGGSPQRHFVWDGASLLAELDGAGTSKQAEYSYYPGLDNPHALIVGSTQYFAHTDGLGSVIALTDTFENVQRTYDYGAWGGLTGGVDVAAFAGKDRARFKGALWLGPEVEVYYMRARWYESKTGRFLSEDPIGLAGGLNPYVYAGDDPINGSDPLGLCAVGLYDAEGNLVGRREHNASEGDQMRGRDGVWYTCQRGEWVPSGSATGASGGVAAVGEAGDVGEQAQRECQKASFAFGATFVLDATTLLGVSVVVRFGLVGRSGIRQGLRQGAAGHWWHGGRAAYGNGIRNLAQARARSGSLARDELLVGAPATLGLEALTDSPFHVGDFVPGWATKRAWEATKAACLIGVE
jgi:RHS repeat-associated protein